MNNSTKNGNGNGNGNQDDYLWRFYDNKFTVFQNSAAEYNDADGTDSVIIPGPLSITQCFEACSRDPDCQSGTFDQQTCHLNGRNPENIIHSNNGMQVFVKSTAPFLFETKPHSILSTSSTVSMSSPSIESCQYSILKAHKNNPRQFGAFNKQTSTCTIYEKGDEIVSDDDDSTLIMMLPGNSGILNMGNYKMNGGEKGGDDFFHAPHLQACQQAALQTDGIRAGVYYAHDEICHLYKHKTGFDLVPSSKEDDASAFLVVTAAAEENPVMPSDLTCSLFGNTDCTNKEMCISQQLCRNKQLAALNQLTSSDYFGNNLKYQDTKLTYNNVLLRILSIILSVLILLVVTYFLVSNNSVFFLEGGMLLVICLTTYLFFYVLSV